MHLLTLIKRYLGNRFLADSDRAEPSKFNQNTARTNAAEASATLGRRRRDHDDVEAYLRARRLSHPAG